MISCKIKENEGWFLLKPITVSNCYHSGPKYPYLSILFKINTHIFYIILDKQSEKENFRISL
jgi:hypothetical protein